VAGAWEGAWGGDSSLTRIWVGASLPQGRGGPYIPTGQGISVG
jgi:hypothetical protein